MPERLVDIEIRSNLDALDAKRIHEGLVRMVDEAASGGAEFMRGIAPMHLGALKEHVSHTHARDLGESVEASLGVPPIGTSYVPGTGGTTVSPRFSVQPSDSSKYPLFVDRGTGVFGSTGSPTFARKGKAMRFERGGQTIFATSTKGQKGQHFLAATYAYVHHVLLREGAERLRVELDAMAAQAALHRFDGRL